jgi:hypothetical protein
MASRLTRSKISPCLEFPQRGEQTVRLVTEAAATPPDDFLEEGIVVERNGLLGMDT